MLSSVQDQISSKNYIFKGYFHTQEPSQRETLSHLEMSYVVILRNSVRSPSVACSEQKLTSFTKTWRIHCISPFSSCPEVAVLFQCSCLTQPSVNKVNRAARKTGTCVAEEQLEWLDALFLRRKGTCLLGLVLQQQWRNQRESME